MKLLLVVAIACLSGQSLIEPKVPNLPAPVREVYICTVPSWTPPYYVLCYVITCTRHWSGWPTCKVTAVRNSSQVIIPLKDAINEYEEASSRPIGSMTQISVADSDIFTEDGHSYAIKKGTYPIIIEADGSYSVEFEFIEVN